MQFVFSTQWNVDISDTDELLNWRNVIAGILSAESALFLTMSCGLYFIFICCYLSEPVHTVTNNNKGSKNLKQACKVDHPFIYIEWFLILIKTQTDNKWLNNANLFQSISLSVWLTEQKYFTCSNFDLLYFITLRWNIQNCLMWNVGEYLQSYVKSVPRHLRHKTLKST